MKTGRILALGLALALTMAIGGTIAAAEEEAPRPVDAVLADIRTEQGVAANDAIDVAKVSDGRLEQLGDAVMEASIGDSAMHERMDAMLGGEGSANLTAYHEGLGRAYLAALVAGRPLPTGGAFPGGMMGGRYRGGMMGGRYRDGMVDGSLSAAGWVATIGGLVLMALAAALLVVLIIRFSRKPKA